MTTTTIETTSYTPTRWNLSELLPEPSESIIADRLTTLEADVQAFIAQREKLNPAMNRDEFLAIMRQYEALVERIYVLGAYGSLWFSEDTQSSDALTYRNRMQQVLTDVNNRTLFFNLWWKELDDAQAEALLPPATDQTAMQADFRHYLQDSRRTKPYTLDEKSEQLINTKDANGIDGVLTLYSMLTNRLEFMIEVDGERKTLTRDALMAYAQSPRAELRAAAYQELYRVYE
nr:oligoendopeptidase F [Acidobacteriota bacterium]